MTVREQLEAILSQYAAMRIHQQVAIDQILEVTKPVPDQSATGRMMLDYHLYHADGG